VRPYTSMQLRSLLTSALCALLAVPCGASTTKLFTPIPTPNTALVAPADPDHFTFVVSGDNRSAGPETPMPASLDEICREIGWIHPEFTLWTGDCIEGYGDTPAQANAEYDAFLAGTSLIDGPVFNAPGNHEFSLDPELLPVYLKRMGPLYGSFDYGNSHFVVLNSSPPNPDGTIMSADLNDTEWMWLESDLKTNQGAKNIFVMLHHYVFGPPDPDTPDVDTGWKSIAERDRFHAMMVKYGVRAVFCGHAHLYWHENKDGVDYYISGGAGAPLDTTPDKGGYYHYLLFTVNGNTATPQILQPWHLELDYPNGNSGTSPTAKILATNTNFFEVTAGHIVAHLAAPPAGETLTVTAFSAYKKKVKPVAAQIVSVTPDPNGGVDAVVSAALTPAHTVEIDVAPATH
jgi:hypothetical protein